MSLLGSVGKKLTSGGIGKILGYSAGGMLASSYLSHLSGVKKNFYGDDEYQSRYNGGIDAAAAIAPYVGIAGGLASATGHGPLGLLRRTSATYKKTITLPGSLMARRTIIRDNIATKFAARAERQSLVRIANPGKMQGGYVGTGVHNGLYQPTNFKGPSASSVERARSFRAYRSSLMKQPGIMSFLGGQSGIQAGALIASNPGTTAAAVGGLAGVATLRVANKVGGLGGVAGMGAIAGAGYAGMRVAGSNRLQPAGEGNITDFRVNAQSTANRMDFNTAGLVQALHYNK